MENHFKGIVPEERWKNDVLSELRMIRELLERDCKVLQQEPEQHVKVTKQTQQRRGAK